MKRLKFSFGVVFAALLASPLLVSAADAKKVTLIGRVPKICAQISKIKELPFEARERGIDKIYDKFLDAGDTALPCLINAIADSRRMPDPRCPHVTDGTTVGDVAYFVFIHLSRVSFTEMLPPDVAQNFKVDGVYAYHEYIKRRGARTQLQLKLRNWYRTKFRNI